MVARFFFDRTPNVAMSCTELSEVTRPVLLREMGGAGGIRPPKTKRCGRAA